MRLITIFAAAAMLVAATLEASAQPRIFPLSALKADKTEIRDYSDPLSNFPEDGLPEAAIIGSNPSFQAGAETAREILKFEENALPLLIAALQKGGFGISDERGKVLYQPRSGPGLDIGFFDFEVAGMLRGVGLGVGTSLNKLAAKYAGDGTDMPAAEVARRMLADIRAMRDSKDPHIQFNAGMLFEMSKIAGTDGDLATSPPNAIKLNMIQASIVERLLLLDLLTRFEELAGDSAGFIVAPAPQIRSGVQFVKAGWNPPAARGVCDWVTDLGSLKKYYKTGKKVVTTVKTFNELSKDLNTLDKIKNSQTVKGASIVNAALAWAKTIMAFLNVKATFELEQPMPLIRTKRSGNTTGEVRNVTVKVEMDINKSDLVNCIGTALSTVSDIGFSIPKGGPLSGVKVEWEVLLASRSTGFWASLIQGRDYDKFTSLPTFVDAADRGDISRQVTDANGKNTIKLTGKPQPSDLTGLPVVPLPKKVNLKAKFALDKIDAQKDIGKIVKLGLGTSIDPLSVIEWVADFVTKIPLKASQVTVPVRDWQPCTADWGGTITYKRERRQTIVVKGTRTSNGNSTGDGFRQIIEVDNADVELSPRTNEEMAAGVARKPAVIYVNGLRSDIFTGRREGDPCCGPVEGSYTVSFRDGKEEKYSSVVTDLFDVYVNAGQRDFSISLGLRTPMFKTDTRRFFEVDESNCPLDTETANQELGEGMLSLMAQLESGRHGERYVDETGEVMGGTKTLTGPDNSTITWSWQLGRCGRK